MPWGFGPTSKGSGLACLWQVHGLFAFGEFTVGE